MLSTDREYMQYYHSNTYHLKPEDINFDTQIKLWRNYSYLPNQIPTPIKLQKPIHVFVYYQPVV